MCLFFFFLVYKNNVIYRKLRQDSKFYVKVPVCLPEISVTEYVLVRTLPLASTFPHLIYSQVLQSVLLFTGTCSLFYEIINDFVKFYSHFLHVFM